MRKNAVRFVLMAMVSATVFTGCKNSKGTSNISRATGMKINNKAGGFQYNTNFKEQATGPGLVFIEGGTFTMGKVQDDIMHDWNNTPTQQHVQSFYMDETEVTNIMYVEYLYWLNSMFPPEDPKYRKIYNGALPDTLVWRNRLGYNEVMTNNYLRHPAYAEYPVVGVNWIQAVQFSDWRTDRVNEQILGDQGFLERDASIKSMDIKAPFDTDVYLSQPEKTYGGGIDSLTGKRGQQRRDTTTVNTYAGRTSGVALPDYRLPTEVEWEYAALSLVGIRNYNTYRGKKKYPWLGEYTRSGRRKIKGDQLANFKQGKGDYGGIAGWSDDGADITNQVKSYPPNDYGLYDMAGNVAEWVADVYRPIVDDEANDFNYYRGNEYYKNNIGPDGKATIVSVDSVTYDTLSNGRIIARNLPGALAQVPVDESDTYLRTNFSKSDNRNYRDGDFSSSRYFERFFDEEEENEDTNKVMYNAPKHTISADTLGNMIREYDKSTQRTTLIDDEARVFKGGSWRDRAYWLDPAQRRYLPQYMATDYIGFRNAMSRVGSKSKKKKTPRG
ncbi:gliding motility lipoprotein GldJ [Sungkyunkwania multivorans]|uniref:Gliding motility lipoprotein GldJ n=1 Tax=Sungkyunkwania multivorans TaxID=1173618 RepID=A0ABW3D1R2_9FLAO